MEGLPTARCEALIVKALKRKPTGLNAYELEQRTGLTHGTLTPRLAPLRRKGLIAESGIYRTGATNRKQIVWKAL